MPQARTTICVVPRDKFAHAVPSLCSILTATPPPRRLVYVDGGSPEPVRAALERLAVEHDFTLLRTDHYLAPNEARNFTLGHVATEFALFVDNDVYVPDDFVSKLEDAADVHTATAVAPVYGIASGPLDSPRVHHAGANGRVVEVDGARVLDTSRYVVEDADPDGGAPRSRGARDRAGGVSLLPRARRCARLPRRLRREHDGGARAPRLLDAPAANRAARSGWSLRCS